MTRFTLSAAVAALALAVAAPAFADQLACNAGVGPGVYTDAQLVELIHAQEDDNFVRVNQILGNPQGSGSAEPRVG